MSGSTRCTNLDLPVTGTGSVRTEQFAWPAQLLLDGTRWCPHAGPVRGRRPQSIPAGV